MTDGIVAHSFTHGSLSDYVPNIFVTKITLLVTLFTWNLGLVRLEGLLPSTGIEPPPFRNSASKVAVLQMYATVKLITYSKLNVSAMQKFVGKENCLMT